MGKGTLLWIWGTHLWLYLIAAIPIALLTLFFCWFFWRRYKARWQQAEDERMELQSKLTHVARDYQELEEQSRKDARQLQDFEQEIAATDKRQQESMQEIARAKRSVSNYMANIEALRIERDRLQEEVHAHNAPPNEDLNASRAELEELKEALSDSEHRCSRLGTELQLMRTIRTEFNALRQDNMDLEEDLAAERKANAELEARIEELTVTTEDAREEKQAAERELGRLRSELAQARHRSTSAISPDREDAPAQTLADQPPGERLPSATAPVDDLTAIDGIAGRMEAKLNELGVYRYAQIANWTDDNVESYSLRLGFKDRIQRDQWREQAAALLEDSAPPSTSTQPPPPAATNPSPAATNPSPAATNPSPALQGFAGSPKQPAEPADGLFVHQPSLFAAATEEPKTETSLPDSPPDDASRSDSSPPDSSPPDPPPPDSSPPDPPLADAAAPSSNGDHVTTDPNLGMLFTQRPSDVDDLTQVKGIAKVLEKRLHEVGVYRYKQVALWSDDHVEEFSQRLSFHDRIQRDRWREQCLDLHQEKYGEILRADL